MRILLFGSLIFSLTGCSHKLFPSAHVSNKISFQYDTLYYYYDYTESDEFSDIKLNSGWQYGKGLKAMNDMDSILNMDIKSFGYDTVVRLQLRDKIVVDSMWNKFNRKLNDSAILLTHQLSDNLQNMATILKVRLNVSIFVRSTSGLGFYSNGTSYGNYLGIMIQTYKGEIQNLRSLRATPNFITMKHTMFYPMRSRRFLDRILK
jgi:hypothetical protein